MTFTGRIYRIFLEGMEDICYVGSTTKVCSDRLKDHKYSAKCPSNGYHFASHVLFQEGNEPKIECLDEDEFHTREELLERERIWMDKYPNRVNKNPPILSDDERHERQKATLRACYYKKQDERIAKQRIYKQEHKDAIKAQRQAKNATRVKCPICQKEMSYCSLTNHKRAKHSSVT